MDIDNIHFYIKMDSSMYKRAIEKDIDDYLNSKDKKILFIWGPRRSGKTTLLNKISQKAKTPIFNFDLVSDREYFVPKRYILEKLCREQPLILIDEVQSYPESTVALKAIFDEFNCKIIATGSSELRQKSAESFDSLAGRYRELFCLPFSVLEIEKNTRDLKEYQMQSFYQNLAEGIMIYGSYPEIAAAVNLSDGEKFTLLKNILESYVIKDIINIYNLKDAKLALDILIRIALQLGSEVSVRELSNSLSANASTVASYLEIFVKNYILIPLNSFSTNLRRSVSKNKKYYFYDLGIRNILVKDFRPLALRPDAGGVFENFIISEIEKAKKTTNKAISFYFYREYAGGEIDLIAEDYKKNYLCFEIKLKNAIVKDIFPLPHKLKLISLENYSDIIKSFS